MINRAETAVKYHEMGYNCAQSVIFAFIDKLNIDFETAKNITGGMGGGMRMGEVCGALSGGVSVIGLKNGFSIPDKFKLYEIITQFNNQFISRNGSAVCRELIGYNFSIPAEQTAAINDPAVKEKCCGFVASAVEILEKLLGD